MKVLRVVALLALGLVASGCTHVEYTRGWRTAEAATTEAPQGDYGFDYHTNEVVLTDRLGIVCASLSTTTEAYANAIEGGRKAEEEGKRSYTVTYHRHSPAEYVGAECGGYYAWATNRPATYVARNLPDEPSYEAESNRHEAGLQFGGVGPLVPRYLRGAARIRLGMGKHHLTTDVPNGSFPESRFDNDDDKFFFRFPITFGLLVYPWFLYGFGIEAYGGADILSWAFSQSKDKVWTKLDYSARAGYSLSLKNVAITVTGGWQHAFYAWADYDVRFDEFMLTGALDFNLTELF